MTTAKLKALGMSLPIWGDWTPLGAPTGKVKEILMELARPGPWRLRQAPGEADTLYIS